MFSVLETRISYVPSTVGKRLIPILDVQSIEIKYYKRVLSSTTSTIKLVWYR